MYRFFYDWEFQEKQDKETGLTTIYPISLGMIDSNDNELYLINNTFFKWEYEGKVRTSEWVKDNVLDHITDDDQRLHGHQFDEFGDLIKDFICSSFNGNLVDRSYVELWGYFADYDHVCFCQCFGSMMQLPYYIPMYTNDLKQLVGGKRIGFKPEDEHHALSDARWNKKVWEMFNQDDR